MRNYLKIHHLIALSKPEQSVNFKTWQFIKKYFFIGRKCFCCKSVYYRRELFWLQERVEIKVLRGTLKNEKHCNFLFSKSNEKEEKISKLNVRNVDKRMEQKKT